MYPQFARDYTRARELQLEAWRDQALLISNSPLMGEETEETVMENDRGATRITKRQRREMLGHRRLQVDTIVRLTAAVQQQQTVALQTRLITAKLAERDEGGGGIRIEGGLPPNGPAPDEAPPPPPPMPGEEPDAPPGDP